MIHLITQPARLSALDYRPTPGSSIIPFTILSASKPTSILLIPDLLAMRQELSEFLPSLFRIRGLETRLPFRVYQPIERLHIPSDALMRAALWE